MRETPGPMIPRLRLLAASVAVSLLSLVSLGDAAGSASAAMSWSYTDDPAALCNDFTRSGFFHRPPAAIGGEREGSRWLLHLESGSYCLSSTDCNKRYLHSAVRERYSRGGVSSSEGFGDFDTSHAWAQSGGQDAAERGDGKKLATIVNPLMTSTSCFNGSRHFQGGLTVEGRDILDRGMENSVFRSHGQVLVPYCSSDVWLGSEGPHTRDYVQKKKSGRDVEYCECWDSNCFQFDPSSTELQFTFRGKTIFQSVIRTLDRMYDLEGAQEMILVGSSAGGLGVINLAKWVKDTYPHLDVKVIADSSWFVNFRDGINRQFNAVRNMLQEINLTSPLPSSSSQPLRPSSTSQSLPPSATSQSPLPSASSQPPLPSSTSQPSLPSASSQPSIPSSTSQPSFPSPSSLPPLPSSTSLPPLPSSTSQPSLISSTSQPPLPSSTSLPPLPSPTSDSDSYLMPLPTETPYNSSTAIIHTTLLPTSSDLAPSLTVSPTPSPSNFPGEGSGSESDYWIGSGLENFTKRSAKEEGEEDVTREIRSSGQEEQRNNVSLLRFHETCHDTRSGYPCCLSAECVLTESDPTTHEPYFRSDVPIFIINSLYDVFILSQALIQLSSVNNDEEEDLSAIALELLTTISEYGGVMSSSLNFVQDAGRVDLSYYTSQCFQHIYLSTSTLRGEGSLLGTEVTTVSPGPANFR